MKILDRYVIKQFVETILFGLLAFTVIFVVIDMMENLDDFIDQNVPSPIIFEYYLYFIPDILKLMTPVAVLFASLFTMGKLSNQNEITAIKSSGISIYRIMYPLIIVSLFISGLSVYFGGYIVPKANKYKVELEMTHLKRGFNFSGSNLFFQDKKNTLVSISFYNEAHKQANRVSIQKFDDDDPTRMISRIDASRMVFDTISYNWIAYNGTVRKFERLGESIEYFFEKKIGGLLFLPNDLAFKQQKPEQMNLPELAFLAEHTQRSGNDPRNILIEYYGRFSFAAASFICVLFGLPLSVNKRKGGLALQFGINVLITFVYLGFMKIFQAFGKNGALDPLITSWLVNILFFAGAIVNLLRIKQ